MLPVAYDSSSDEGDGPEAPAAAVDAQPEALRTTEATEAAAPSAQSEAPSAMMATEATEAAVGVTPSVASDAKVATEVAEGTAPAGAASALETHQAGVAARRKGTAPPANSSDDEPDAPSALETHQAGVAALRKRAAPPDCSSDDDDAFYDSAPTKRKQKRGGTPPSKKSDAAPSRGEAAEEADSSDSPDKK